MNDGDDKKVGRLDLRGTPEEVDRFQAACAAVGATRSAVIRDLCRAAVLYIAEHCKDGRWHPPVLLTETDTAVLQLRMAAESEAVYQTRRRKRPGPTSGQETARYPAKGGPFSPAPCAGTEGKRSAQASTDPAKLRG